ncbi:MAG: hypothetical protein ACMG55_11600 [Microcoleus sp.]
MANQEGLKSSLRTNNGVAGLKYETLGSDRIIDESYPESATPQ